METTNFEELELACVEAFVQGDYDRASQLLPNLKQPAAVRTAYDIVPYITEFATAKEVTLLHLASLNGWMDMVTTLLSVYNCNSQCTDSRGQTPLHFAAYGGNLLVVNYLITEQHCDPLLGNCDGSNSLHYACLGGHLELTRCLITKHGCDPNLPDHIDNMPLHAACFSKFSSLKIVKYLITEQHCDTNSRRQYGRTPLHDACYCGHMDIIQYLITEQGCDPALPDNDGNMPIHIACLGGSLDVVKYLISEQDSNFKSRGKNDWTALHCACYNGNVDLIDYLITQQCFDPDIPDVDGDKPIHIACLNGKLDIVKYLIMEKKCDINSKGKNGRTTLHRACCSGHMGLIQFLISEVGIDPDNNGDLPMIRIVDNDGYLPIHYACLNDHLTVVKYLINEHYCDPNCRGKYGRTILLDACGKGYMSQVQYLISEIGCDPALSDNDGNTLIHLACSDGHLSVIKYLITKVGCDPALPNNDGNMPIHLACFDGHLNVVKYLITKHHCDPIGQNKNGNTPLHYACRNGYMNLIQYLISEVGCDPAFPDNDGDTPMHFACFGGHLSVIKYLITKHHCDPISRNKNGITPLHSACENGHMDLIQYLISELGSDPALPNNDGNTPIHLACSGGHLSVVKYLITKYQCDPISWNKNGITPLHYACENGHMDLIQYLISELGCDPALPDNSGTLPIHFACSGGNLSVVKYLITEQHCNPNIANKLGRTLLYGACGNGRMDVIKYLITELGCDPALPDNNGLLPIHIACVGNHLNVVKYLINEQLCSPNSTSKNGRTPLHIACDNGHMDLIQYLITEQCCDPTFTDNDGSLPLHLACSSGHLSVVTYLIMEHHCNPISRNTDGLTPLHYALFHGHMGIIQFLIRERGCGLILPDDGGNTLIHFACFNGHLNLVQYLILEQHCDPNIRNKGGETPLHIACLNGYIDLIDYFITELGCDPAIPDSNGSLPIHCACFRGHLNVVKHLITVHHCDTNSRDKEDWTPLHHACIKSRMDVINYLITEIGCDPMDSNNKPLLHLASLFGQTLVVQRLLQDKRVNLLSFDQFGRTPLFYAELSDNSYELLKLFHPLLQSKYDYPIHLFTKTILTGNSGVGKSSLAEVVIKHSKLRLSPRFVDFVYLHKDLPLIAMERLGVSSEVRKVETLTAGIDSYVVESESIGNVVLYDLAGQPEYYFSQSVIMETVMQKTPAIFINLVDLSKSEEEITQAIHYWLTFIDNAASKANSKSCILMVGSHTDLLDEKQLQSRTRLVEDLMDRRVKKLNCTFIAMDCRKTNDDFFILLSRCQNTISAYSSPVSLYCHMLYSFLQTKLHKVACQLQYLSTTLPGSIVPTEISFLSELLEYLSDKGLIIYLKNKQCLEKSWVVVKREVILKDINGVLFAPKYFRGYRPIASSTGIIRMSSLSELFPQYDPEMLVKLIIRLEFCHPVNLSNVSTNLQPTEGSTDATDKLLFFPCLLRAERPTYSEVQCSTSQQVVFGWCLGCIDYEYQFLTSRFLHVLLLRLAYTFPLPSKGYSKGHNLYGLEQRCTVWTNGISWNNSNGIRTVVEVIQQSRWVVVTMYHNKDITRPVEYSKHRSAVIRMVLNLQKELAPDLDTLECLISPSLLQQWPLERLPESDLFTITDVASSILCRNSSILSYKDGSNQLSTEKILFFEPYHLLSPPTVCELMDSSKSDQPVSSTLLNEVRECCQQPQLESQSHLSLRKHLDNMSIFTGRNPLVVADLDSDDVVKQSLPVVEAVPAQHTRAVPTLQAVSNPAPNEEKPAFIVDLIKVPDGILDNSHLSVLVTALSSVYQWFPLGIHLGLNYSDLKIIEANEMRQVEMCKINMLAMWLKGPEENRNKQFLQNALQQLSNMHKLE